jgi:hypothetical protein
VLLTSNSSWRASLLQHTRARARAHTHAHAHATPAHAHAPTHVHTSEVNNAAPHHAHKLQQVVADELERVVSASPTRPRAKRRPDTVRGFMMAFVNLVATSRSVP